MVLGSMAQLVRADKRNPSLVLLFGFTYKQFPTLRFNRLVRENRSVFC